MRTIRPRRILCSTPDSTLRATTPLQNSAVQDFKASSLGLNTAANMPGGAANTFPIFSRAHRPTVRAFLNWELTTLRFMTTTGTTPDPRPGSTAATLSNLAQISVIRCLALTTTCRPESYGFIPVRRLCRPPRAKTFMEPASAMVSRASLLANWMAQVSGTITFNGFTA